MGNETHKYLILEKDGDWTIVEAPYHGGGEGLALIEQYFDVEPDADYYVIDLTSVIDKQALYRRPIGVYGPPDNIAKKGKVDNVSEIPTL